MNYFIYTSQQKVGKQQSQAQTRLHCSKAIIKEENTYSIVKTSHMK